MTLSTLMCFCIELPLFGQQKHKMGREQKKEASNVVETDVNSSDSREKTRTVDADQHLRVLHINRLKTAELRDLINKVTSRNPAVVEEVLNEMYMVGGAPPEGSSQSTF